jgi:hypothetical protein
MIPIERYIVNTVQSGEEETYIWVSLHFESPATEYDRIHIVCSKRLDHQDRDFGTDPIYLERYDQLFSCADGASEIQITDQAVYIALLENASKQLGFSGSLVLEWTSDLEGYEQAREHFTLMNHHTCGRIFDVEDCR